VVSEKQKAEEQREEVASDEWRAKIVPGWGKVAGREGELLRSAHVA
jgi:hypothetical protein